MADHTVTLTDDERNLLFTALSQTWIIQPRDAAEPTSADALFYKLNDLDTSPPDPHRERYKERAEFFEASQKDYYRRIKRMTAAINAVLANEGERGTIRP